MLLVAHSCDRGKRLDTFLQEQLANYSRSRLQSWIKAGRVLVGGSALRASYLLKGGEEIEVEPAALPPLRAEAEDLPLRIVYEDRDVIVVDKPAGMVVHAGAGNTRGTLVNALLHHFGTLSSVNGDMRPGIVHRLDKETSGLLVVARNDEAHRHLSQQFQDRTVEKIYLALVHGNVQPAEGKLTSPITRDPVRRTRMTANLGHGRSALTTYQTKERLGVYTLLEVKIGTGRTHQIRVHLSSLRHAVVGDKLYGAAAAPAGLPPLNRFFLHAHRLSFVSPSSGERIAVESPLPPEFQELLETIREQAAAMDVARMKEIR